MPTLRCKPGDMGRVVRNTFGLPCHAHHIGKVLYCQTLHMTSWGDSWWELKTPETCPGCGGKVLGFLDADLDPIRPPPLTDTTKTNESKPVEVEHG